MYSDRFNTFIPFILKEECDWPNDKTGQYSNDPDDPGSSTKWGIDLTSYKEAHPDATDEIIKNLTYEQALDIYWNDYWLKDKIETSAYPLGEAAANSFINGGHPAIWLKQCKGSAPKFIDLQEQYYKDLCTYWAAKKKPNPYKYLPDWLGRTDRLRDYLNIAKS